jgi:hypothetical protein
MELVRLNPARAMGCSSDAAMTNSKMGQNRSVSTLNKQSISNPKGPALAISKWREHRVFCTAYSRRMTYRRTKGV